MRTRILSDIPVSWTINPNSSFANYLSEPLVDSSMVFEITGQDEFYRYLRLNKEDACLDIEANERKRLPKEPLLLSVRFESYHHT